MNNVDTVETERLIGRRIRPGDFDLLCQLLQNPEVAATLGGVRSDEEGREFLAAHLEHWERLGSGGGCGIAKRMGGLLGGLGCTRKTLMVGMKWKLVMRCCRSFGGKG